MQYVILARLYAVHLTHVSDSGANRAPATAVQTCCASDAPVQPARSSSTRPPGSRCWPPLRAS
eukprot:7808655-Lingulodinium_polyedra.AAC.1